MSRQQKSAVGDFILISMKSFLYDRYNLKILRLKISWRPKFVIKADK